MAFKILREDITKLEVDAIVCTERLPFDYAASYDSHIYLEAGIDMVKADMRQFREIKEGEAVITPGHNLPSKFIIHAVLPDTAEAQDWKKLLASMYRRCIRIARVNGLISVAVPVFRASSRKLSAKQEIRIAISEITAYIKRHPEMDVTLAVLTDETFTLAHDKYPELDSAISKAFKLKATRERSGISTTDEDEEFEELKSIITVMRIGPGSPYSSSLKGPELKSSERKGANGFAGSFTGRLAGGMSGAARKSAEMATWECEDICEMSVADAASPALSPVSSPAAYHSLDEMLDSKNKTFMEMVFTYSDEQNMTDPELYNSANINRKAFNKLKNGNVRQPKKNTALALAVALHLNLDQTRDLLARVGLALSPCDAFDIIVSYFINEGGHNVLEINEALFDRGIKECLGSDFNE